MGGRTTYLGIQTLEATLHTSEFLFLHRAQRSGASVLAATTPLTRDVAFTS
jgi:hypothetical protein